MQETSHRSFALFDKRRPKAGPEGAFAVPRVAALGETAHQQTARDIHAFRVLLRRTSAEMGRKRDM